ncbi:MAG: DevR family CRISPR-associated autoregulator [Sarcina sp.]
MKKRLVNAITATILVSSQIPLSYDESEGNITVIKKIPFKEKEVPVTSIGTVTYELRKSLRENCNWTLDSIVLNKSGDKIKNIYSKLSNVESLEENGLESEVMGYFIPSSGKDTISKTSPLRIIPFRGLDSFPGTTQIITNRGMLDINDGREYFTPEGEKIEIDEKFPTSQAFVYEEIVAGYYVYTVTIELNRIGVKEIKDGKVVAPEQREYMSKELREKAVKDILEVLTIFTRRIKHSTVLLKPLLVVGGAYEKVIPFFCEDIDYEKNTKKITLEYIKETIEAYNLEEETIVAIDKRVEIAEKKSEDDKVKNPLKIDVKKSPVQAIKKLADSLVVGEDNRWYVIEEDKEEAE